ncbi:MAG: histidine kinase N-terminal 7TM domain-containing protein [Ignavibacteria bacterium]|jgi:signal transduction histidine kinase
MLNIQSIILYILLTTALLSFVVTYFLYKRKKTPGVLYFSLTALSVSIWSVGYIIEFYVQSLEVKFLGVQIQYTLGIPFTTVFWLFAALHMRTFGKHPNKSEFILLLIIPVITMVLIWTNDLHHLVYAEMSLYRDEHFLLIQKQVGIWYYINVVYSYTILTIGSIVLLIAIRKSRDFYKGQLVLFFIIAVLPWIANIIYITGMNSYMRIDITPVGFILSLILVEVAGRRFALFDLVPAAHSVVIESMNNGIIVIDGMERIIKINPYMQKIFGGGEIVGRNIKGELTRLGIDPGFMEKDDELYEVELGKFIFDVRISGISNVRGNTMGKVFTFYDITRRKNAERELRELNSSKDRLFSIIAHDLKNPFYGIVGLSDIFSNEYEDMTEEEIKVSAKAINELADNTYKILENLLDWSRQQTGQMAFSPVKFNVKEAINQYIKITEHQAKLKSIKIITDFEDGVFVFADPYMFNTVIRNLISNAVKFSYTGGQITVSVKTGRGFAKISVTDNGTGMDDETMKRIFKIDEDVKTVGTMGERGTGLGLILCKDFVEKNGGQIFVESKLSKGSTFSFTVPIQE